MIRRDFTHPPAKAWRALTDAKLIPKWPVGMKRCEKRHADEAARTVAIAGGFTDGLEDVYGNIEDVLTRE